APNAVARLAELRAISIRADVVQRISAADVNVATERLDGQAYDLVVATNVFIYYDTFDKMLALSNIAAMLRPGGLLLSNNVMPLDAASTLRLAGSNETLYWRPSADTSSRAYGDHLFWYQRK